MRDPTGAELLLLARVLLPFPAQVRSAAAACILAEVDEADLLLRFQGIVHPVFGDGSLMVRCLRLSPPAEPMAADPDFLAAMIAACHVLLHHSKR